tara:strand:- start:1880 stop:2758 length:879 start_codon:yes stop_codon:yes gene_type:complete
MSIKKGIILAGGSGKRLHPLTLSISKQLLPIYDKPMIYYPLSTLIIAGVIDVLIICNPGEDILFKKLLRDGSQLGINISYKVQEKPEGIAQALLIGKDFIDNSSCILILGDNIFYGQRLEEKLISAGSRLNGATVFAHEVKDPERYGVVEFDSSGKAISIIEKPSNPKSNYAVTGLYFFDSNAHEIASSLTPSARGELEITDVNAEYLKMGNLQVEVLDKTSTWLDAGTHQSYQESSEFVSLLNKKNGINLACLEVEAYKKGLLDKEQLRDVTLNMGDSYYQNYLMQFLESE